MRKLLVLVAVLILLVVGLDVGGRALAQSRVATEIGRQTGRPAPSVTIHGFSFLAQALPGHYQHVTLTSPGIAVGPITDIEATIELYDVDLPLGNALKGNTSNLVAGHATVRGVVSDADVSAAINKSGTVVSNAVVSSAPDGAIRVGGQISVAGQRIPVSGDLVASFSGGALHLQPTDLRAAGFALPDVPGLTGQLSLTLALHDLPFAVQAATLVPAGSDLVLTATADDVRLDAVS